MSELTDKVKKSIERLKAFCPEEGYYLAFSGGKDSVVCKALLEMSGCKHDSTYRVTSVDPPELVRFIKDVHPDVKREVPRYGKRRGEKWEGKPITMWNLIPWKRMPPTRIARYCCEFLKESGGDGRMTVTGVRWAESRNRKENQGSVTIVGKTAGRELGDNPDFTSTARGGVVLTNDNTDSRKMIEQCYKRHKTTVNPIIEWSDTDVWEFIRANGIPYCSLYDEGFTRLGCIGCPMARRHGRAIEFARWPKYRDIYIRTFDEMLAERRKNGKTNGTWANATGLDVFRWWMEFDVLPGQYDLFENEVEESQ